MMTMEHRQCSPRQDAANRRPSRVASTLRRWLTSTKPEPSMNRAPTSSVSCTTSNDDCLQRPYRTHGHCYRAFSRPRSAQLCQLGMQCHQGWPSGCTASLSGTLALPSLCSSWFTTDAAHAAGCIPWFTKHAVNAPGRVSSFTTNEASAPRGFQSFITNCTTPPYAFRRSAGTP